MARHKIVRGAQDNATKSQIENKVRLTKTSKNGTIQASEQEEKAGKAQETNQVGAFLDSAENIRQDKKNPSRQAYKAKEKLAKDKDKGMKK